MKSIMRSSSVLVVVCLLAPPVMADISTYTFVPRPLDLYDLAHANYYTWGIDWDLPTGETISSATLTFNNIWDWTAEPDQLYVRLLNDVTDRNGNRTPNWQTTSNGSYHYETITLVGNDSRAGDQFQGQGVPLAYRGQTAPLGTPWNDPKGGHNGAYAVNLSYDILPDNFSWLSDGNFGFGIDPDCHYYNSGIQFTITTKPNSVPAVPVPGAVLLGALGLGLVGFVKKRFS